MDREKVLKILNKDADDIANWAVYRVSHDELPRTFSLLGEIASDKAHTQIIRIGALHSLKILATKKEYKKSDFWITYRAIDVASKLLEQATALFVARNGKDIIPESEELLNCLVTTSYFISYRIKKFHLYHEIYSFLRS